MVTNIIFPFLATWGHYLWFYLPCNVRSGRKELTLGKKAANKRQQRAQVDPPQFDNYIIFQQKEERHCYLKLQMPPNNLKKTQTADTTPIKDHSFLFSLCGFP